MKAVYFKKLSGLPTSVQDQRNFSITDISLNFIEEMVLPEDSKYARTL